MRNKLITLLVLLIAALIGGNYLSAYLLNKLSIFINPVPLTFSAYYHYFSNIHNPALIPFALKIKASGIVGFILPLILWAFIVALLLKPRQKSLHGDARFASKSDLAKQGFFKPTETSIVVGKKNGKLLYFSGQQFAILAAPTRSGKGVGVVIPNLLTYQGSTVVLDIKQENFNLTSGYRSKILKQKVFLFNPFAEDGRTHRWNPLTYISTNPHQRVSDLSSIANMLYPDAGSEQKFWVAQARNAFLAFSLYLFEQQQVKNKNIYSPKSKRRPMNKLVIKPTLGELFRLSSGDGGDLKTYFKSLAAEPFLSETCKTAFSGLLSQSDDTFSSIMGTFKEPLNPWINPIVDKATSGDDFLLTDVRKNKMSIYIGILPNKLAESRLILNLFFSQLINLNTKELPQNNPELKYQCLLLMDEFTSIGKIEIIANSVSYMAGYNIRLLPIIQSIAQLDASYGKEQARTLITNHALQIIYAPREQQDAKDYSDMLGFTTIKKRSISRGKETSRSESFEQRALMLPQELKVLGADKEVFLYEGIHRPIKCDKIRYYQDNLFTSRLLNKADVPFVCNKNE